MPRKNTRNCSTRLYNFCKIMPKNNFRIKVKEIRKNLNIEMYSDLLVAQIQNFEPYISAKSVMIYYPLDFEFNLLKLLSDKKNFAFPVIADNDIYPVFYNKNFGFRKGRYNINEPIGDIVFDYDCIDLIILPALACDINCNRLGYGKGYYDRFLCKLPSKTTKIIAISSELVFAKVPTEMHDKKVDFVITEKRLYR